MRASPVFRWMVSKGIQRPAPSISTSKVIFAALDAGTGVSASMEISQREFATQPRVGAAATTLGSRIGRNPSKPATRSSLKANSQRFRKQLSAQALRPRTAHQLAPISNPLVRCAKVSDKFDTARLFFFGLGSQGNRLRSNLGLGCASLSGKSHHCVAGRTASPPSSPRRASSSHRRRWTDECLRNLQSAPPAGARSFSSPHCLDDGPVGRAEDPRSVRSPKFEISSMLGHVVMAS